MIKPTIEKNISPFQIGAIPGHRPEEHLFVLQSVLALVEHNGGAIATQLLDLVKFFDSEHLVDILTESYRGNIKGRAYRLLYEMNKETLVTVRTPVGDSKEREMKETIGQGSTKARIEFFQLMPGCSGFLFLEGSRSFLWFNESSTSRLPR